LCVNPSPATRDGNDDMAEPEPVVYIRAVGAKARNR